MQIEYKFRHIQHSQELTDYVADRITKLEKFELKPARAEFTFSSEKECKRVDLHVHSADVEMHATTEADDYFTAVDVVLEKMARQLSRKKAKLQAHKAVKPSKVS